jgi:uncharacterized sulfatase
MTPDRVTRRSFLHTAAATIAAAPTVLRAQRARPNFLILMTEDITANVHCFGDDYSVTPVLDRLAQRGCAYINAWSNAPVCAPAKTTFWSGIYATATGAEHMRSLTRLPGGMKLFPAYLRDSGYFCSLNGGDDFNLEILAGTFDSFASQVPGAVRPASAKGHWRERKAGQPFLAFFDDYGTHESRIQNQSHTNQHFIHDPARVRLPAYHPDTPEVRRDWAQYYDNITTVDANLESRLNELEADRLVDDTIIFFISDHGAGMPRSKRFPYNSGLNVPILVVIPDKFRHLAPKDYVPGGKSRRLIGHVDFAPSILGCAGIAPPDFCQGQAFMGPKASAPRTYNFGFRGRMDERYDLIRTVRDQQYVYIRNYHPHRVYGQHVAYMWGTTTTQVWESMYKAGRLRPPQTYFWEPKPAEELYDLQTDPDEVHNLADSPRHREILDRLRKAHERHELETRDIGFLTEAEFQQRSADANLTPYEIAQDPKRYAIATVLAAANLASNGRAGVTAKLIQNIQHPDSGVRYWGVLGVLIRGATEVKRARAALVQALKDPAPSVQIAAAESLGRFGHEATDIDHAMDVLLKLSNCVDTNAYVSIMALNAISAVGDKGKPYKARVATLPVLDPKSPARVSADNFTKLLHHFEETL